MDPTIVKLRRSFGVGIIAFGAIALLIGLLPPSAPSILRDLRIVFTWGGIGFLFFGLLVFATAKIKPPLDHHRARIDALEERIAHLEGKTIKPPKS